MSRVFEAARACVIQCSNSEKPYRDIESFCTALLDEPGWNSEQVELVQRHALRAILDMKRQVHKKPDRVSPP